MAAVRCFYLCVGDYDHCSCPDPSNCRKCMDSCAPLMKKKRLSLGRSKRKESARGTDKPDDKENDTRFQFLTEDECNKLKKGYTPANTTKSTKWALNNFAAWKDAHAQQVKCPDNLLSSTDPALLCKWLTRFVAETRTTQGKPYPPSTLYQLLTGLLRQMKDVAPGALNFLDKRDLHLKPLHNSLDSLFRNLRTRNIGTSVQHTEIFTKEEEQMLWDTGVLGTSTPQSLLNAVFYMNGKSFCLRGGEDYRRLCLSQIVRQTNPDCYVYTEASSKNKKGTFMEMHVPNKVVHIYSCPAAGERCRAPVGFVSFQAPQRCS